MSIRSLAAAVFALTLAAPICAHAEEPPEAPTRSGSEVVILPAVVGGVLVLGGWAVTAITTNVQYREGLDCYGSASSTYPLAGSYCDVRGPSGDTALASLVPIVGPWIMLNTPGVDGAFAVGMGLTQLAGLLTVAIGVPLGLASRRPVPLTVHVMSDATSAGLSLGGTF